ncbi:uncharacterized protein sytl2a isoform X3 [Amia ocellicauda]|uniref:uncharacterized protein sytl2a isoform X3 n=1 Tax=Amia ocellicauda TaxID=2972642 RepID=UPI003464DDB6
MIDLSYLTEDEQQMIMTVLKRDAELKKAEEDRIKQLQNTVHDNGKLKYMTGEWFYEAKSKRHRDKIHGSDIIRASMRQKKPVTLLELSQTRGGERPSFINNGNRDIFVSPELSGLIEEPEEEEDQEGERKAVNPSLDTKHNRLKLSASSPAKQRLNPFNSVSVRAETADEKDSQLTNGVVQALKTSNGENLPPTQNTLPSVINLNSESPGSSQQNIEQLPVPKKRTKIYKPQDSFSDSDGPFPRLSNKRDSVKNPGTPRGILKHNSSCSSNDSEMLQSGHNVNRPEPPSSRTPNAQTVVPQIAAERVEDSREGTEEFSFNSLERKQVRFSPSVRQKDLNRALELQDGRELGEHDMLDLDSTSTPDAEEDYILDRSEQDNGGGSGLSLTDALTEEFQEPEDSTLTSATTTLSDNAQPLSLSVNEVGPAGAGEREQLRSKGTEPPVAYLGLHSRSTDNCKQGDTGEVLNNKELTKVGSRDIKPSQTPVGQHEYHAESNPLQVSNLVSSSDEKEMSYQPKVRISRSEMKEKRQYEEGQLSPEKEKYDITKVSREKYVQDIPVDSLSISKTHAEDSPQKIATLKSFWEKGISGPKILMSTPKVDSPKDETLIKTPYQESETPSISDIQNEEHMKYTPKSIVVSEEVYDSSASLKPDESKSPKAREQVSESVSFAKHSTHVLQSSPVPLEKHSLSQGDSKTGKISDLNSFWEKESSGPKILMSKPKVDSPKDETLIKTLSQETETPSMFKVQNEEHMKYTPKSIVVSEEVYDSSAALIPDRSESPQAGEQVSESVALAKHSTHVLQSSPVPLVRHLSQEDSKTGKISDLNSFWEKESSGPKILMSKPKVDSPKDETLIKTPSLEFIHYDDANRNLLEADDDAYIASPPLTAQSEENTQAADTEGNTCGMYIPHLQGNKRSKDGIQDIGSPVRNWRNLSEVADDSISAYESNIGNFVKKSALTATKVEKSIPSFETDSMSEVQNEEHMKYTPKSIFVSEEMYNCSAALKHDESESPKAGEQVSESVSLAKHSMHAWQSSPVPLVRQSLRQEEDSKTNKISDLNSPLEKEHSGPKILMSKPKEDSPKDETSIKTPSQETESDSILEVQNEEQMKYNPKSIIVNEEVYDSSAAMIPDESKSPKAGEQVSELVSLAKHSTHVLQSSPVPLVRHLSQEDSKTNKISDLNSPLEKEHSDPKILMSKPKVDSPKDETSIKTPSQETKSDSFSEVQNEEQMKYTPKSIIVNEEVYDSSAALKSEGSENQQAREQVYESVALAKHSTHVLQSSLVPLVRHLSQEDSKTGKINDLKSFWEKEKSGPKIIIGKPKDVTETCFSGTEGKQHLKDSPLQSSKRFTASEIDLRVDDADPSNGIERKSTSSVSRSKPTFTVLSMKERVQNDPIGPTSLQFKNLRDFWGGTSAAQQRPSLVKLKSGSIESMPVNLKNPTSPTSKAQDKNLFLNPNYYAKVLPTEPESIQGRSFGVEEQPMRESKNETEMKVEQSAPQLSEGKTNVGKGPLPEALARKPPSPTVSFQRQGDLTHGKDVGAEQERFFSRVMERSKGFPPQGQSPQSPPLKSMARSSMSSEVPLQTSGTNVSAVCPPQPARRKHKESPNERQYQTVPQPRLEMHEGDLQERLNEIPPEPFNGTHNGSPSKEENESKAPVMKEDLILKKHQSNVLSPWVKPADEEMSFQTQEIEVPVGIGEKMETHSVLQREDLLEEDDSDHEFGEVAKPVRASTPNMAEDIQGKPSSEMQHSSPLCDNTEDNEYEDSSRSSASDTWSFTWASSACYDEDQNLVRRVLERSSNRPVSSSKSLEDISSSLPRDERSKTTSGDELALSVEDVSTVPNTPTTTFLDNEKMKQMSRSVPFLQQESDGTDSTSENSFHIGRKKKIGSSLTNLSNSSGMASMSSVSGSVMSIYSGDFGNVEVKGNIQFAMDYVEQLNEFHIFVVQCKDLAAADPKKNRSDPYVKSYLLPDKGKMGKRKTSVKKKTLNPTYNEILRYRIAMETLKTQTLNLSVWHNDTFGRNSFLGEVDVDLSKWDWNNTQMNFFPLKPRTPSGLQATDYRGEMRLALRFLPQISHSKRTSNAGEVHIWVKDCKSLPIIRGNNIDPFVKCSVLPDTSRKSRQKTRVLKKTANPMFNHTLVYDGFKAEDLREACVELTVWDHDRLVNHFLGGLRLGLGTGKSYGAVVDWMDSNTDEATLWERMIDSPNEWVEDVLPLRMLMMAKSVWK